MSSEFIALGTVNLTDRTLELVTAAVKEGRIGQGPLILQFEEELASWFGVSHAILVSNGTIADTVALAAVQGDNRQGEVILPALTFVAQANAVHYNHLTPKFVDVTDDYEIDLGQVEANISRNTIAIMPTHLLGLPANMDGILEIANKHGLPVIEDSCEALGSRYKSRLVGTLGSMGCFSFFVSHVITTGEGGVIITNDLELAEVARSLRNHGRLSEKPEEKFLFPRIGFSGKMNQLEAAVGLGVMPLLDDIIAKRRENMLFLNRLLGDRFSESPDEYIVPHGYPVQFAEPQARDHAITYLHEKSIECRRLFSSIPTQVPAYAFLGHRLGEFPVAERIGDCGLYVPCHQNLDEADLRRIAKTLGELL